MIDQREHVYDDDPGKGHPDGRTRLAGVSYFLLGNGLIQAAVQFAPGGEGTPLGLVVMNPERLGRKRDALTFDPDAGLEPTIVRLATARGEAVPRAGNLEVSWAEHHGVPAVLAHWTWEDLDVHERFFCPDRRTPRLAREIAIRPAPPSPLGEAHVRTGRPGASVERRLALHPGDVARTWLIYSLEAGGKVVREGAAGDDPLEEDARQFWTRSSHASFGDPLVDRFFRACRWQLPAAVSRQGRVDGSLWQYCREWVRDQSFMALALVMLGHRGLAGVMLRRLLREFVTPEGATIDSSEVRSPDEAELDQNGILLHALLQYVCWTGDADLVASSWDRVVAVAEFPLRREFRHEPSGLLANAREYWERHRIHGIEPGFELAQQLFVAMGLADAAALARLLSHDAEAARWQEAAARIRQAMLAHPVYALVDDRGFIKRRRLDGTAQETVVPLPDADLPPGVPLAGPGEHRLNPDTSAVLPIAFEFVAPTWPPAALTLHAVESLWNQAWSEGGYGRYDVSSEPDSPGGWPFASIFVARAAVEAGLDDRAWRVLRWLDSVPGAAAGSWFEFYGPRVSPPFPQVGIVPWTWAELTFLFVHHVLGVRPEPEGVRLRPRLLTGLERAKATIPVGGRWLRLDVRRGEGGAAPECTVDGRPVAPSEAGWLIPRPADDLAVEVTL